LAACFSFSVLPCFFVLDLRGDFPAMSTPSAVPTLRCVALLGRRPYERRHVIETPYRPKQTVWK
jgi:hypothetical protein